MPSSGDYAGFIRELKQRVASARLTAGRAVNRELVLLYWDIGRAIAEKQRALGWGEAVVEVLAKDLRKAFPGMGGFSAASLWRMRRFFAEHTSPAMLAQIALPTTLRRGTSGAAILSQPVIESRKSARMHPDPSILAQAVRELVATVPWGHHVNGLAQVADPAARFYYLRATARFGWSRNVLLNQIKAGAYEGSHKAGKSHNFTAALPRYLAEQAEEALKSSYRATTVNSAKPNVHHTLYIALIICVIS